MILSRDLSVPLQPTDRLISPVTAAWLRGGISGARRRRGCVAASPAHGGGGAERRRPRLTAAAAPRRRPRWAHSAGCAALAPGQRLQRTAASPAGARWLLLNRRGLPKGARWQRLFFYFYYLANFVTKFKCSEQLHARFD
jgi:hypothetical protein